MGRALLLVKDDPPYGSKKGMEHKKRENCVERVSSSWLFADDPHPSLLSGGDTVGEGHTRRKDCKHKDVHREYIYICMYPSNPNQINYTLGL